MEVFNSIYMFITNIFDIVLLFIIDNFVLGHLIFGTLFISLFFYALFLGFYIITFTKVKLFDAPIISASFLFSLMMLGSHYFVNLSSDYFMNDFNELKVKYSANYTNQTNKRNTIHGFGTQKTDFSKVELIIVDKIDYIIKRNDGISKYELNSIKALEALNKFFLNKGKEEGKRPS